MLERDDDRGHWESADGTVWLLVTPSEAWTETVPEELEPGEPDETLLQAQLAALGAALLAQPELLDQLVASVAHSNTAKGPLEYVNTAVQAAAAVEG